ncbi:MAG: N-6 DNA methylase, partial [Bacteroidales bacterium]
MSKRSSIFNTIRTEGAILPAELLQRIVSGDTTLEGLKSTDYHLSPSERLNEAATRSWNRLIGVWQTYKEILNQLPDEDIGTTETRERWLLPLFQELGYGRLQTQKSIEIEDKTYPISHKASEPIAIHLVSFKWDLDKRNPIAKGETKLSPHSLMQEFLNRSEDHLWGILSNGLKLRILRDNVSLTRAAYVEFDLQAMMDGLAYSDFFLLYLLCHQSRVEVKTDETGRALPPETCWLEKWYNASIKDGVRALDELRNNVQSAIESLGAGFLSHPANTELRDKLRSGNLSLQDYYHQVLLQVYRLLFVFVAEDRDLLIPGDVSEMVKQTYHKYYSTYRIRELARKKRGTRHSDLWQQLNLLFNGLYDGNTALGLPALGSFLFKVRGSEIASLRDTTSLSGHLTTSPSSTPDLDICHIANSELLSAVRFLCYTQKNNIFQPINYRNLGPEELGSVYESLLEMHPEINLEAAYFKLNVVSGSERKTTGSYYTPSSLVNCLLDSALEPVIEAALKGRDTTSPSGHLTTSPSGHLTTSPEKALLALKICDPACGSGHFLIAAAHRLAKHLASIRAGEDEPAPSVVQHALRDVIGHCIYGVDINPMSVELCKISLWMEALEPGKPLTFLDHHIQCGNSLLGCTPALLKKGIPDAAFDHNTGDDKAVCSRFKKLNKDESKGNIDIFSSEREDWLSKRGLQSGIRALNQIADDDLNGLQAKERSYADFVQSQDYQNTKLIYDAWCAAFVWIKDGDPQRPEPITYGIMESIKSDPENVAPLLRQEIMRLAEEYNFFHWHIAFPDVFPLTTSPSGHLTTSPNSGFDCI